jgi:hypothetical protein
LIFTAASSSPGPLRVGICCPPAAGAFGYNRDGKSGKLQMVFGLLEARMNVRYRVELSQTESCETTALLSGGKHAVRKLKRAQVLLAVNAGATDEEIARSVGVGIACLSNQASLRARQPGGGAQRRAAPWGGPEAFPARMLVATACSSPPKGRARWTLELLADELVRLTEHDTISRETVRRPLAENELKPWRKDMWCIPQVDGEFVARMEDVLGLYAEEPNPGGLFRRKPHPTDLRGTRPIKGQPRSA